MLMITRRRGERLLIGDNVEITLVKLRNGAAQLGIVAPRDVTVVRTELLGRQHPGRNIAPPAEVVAEDTSDEP